MVVRMELSRILIRETDDMHIVELREVDGQRVFPIVIGLTEAAAIERRLMGQQPPRPLTHELLADVIESLDAQMEKILITDLKKSTFFAKIVLLRGGERVEIDARPSDAIALGVAQDVPIFVSEKVLEEACQDL